MDTIVTASYGRYDIPHQQARQDVETRWVCFTDDPRLEAPEPWEIVYEAPRYEHPNLAAKWFKCWPRRSSIWIDANIEITSPSFVREARSFIREGLALYRHPRRDCIYEEAKASLGSESQDGRYDELPIPEQMERYATEDHPIHWGLYACGIIAWDVSDPRAWRLGDAWLRECERWGYQDQLSFPVICRRLGITPGVFPHPQITARRRGYLENPWMRLHPHTRPTRRHNAFMPRARSPHDGATSSAITSRAASSTP